MSPEVIERKIAAVLAADIAGFSRLTCVDEEDAVARLRALHAEVVDPEVIAHGGRVFKRTGDGFLAEFRSVVAATRCAIEIQRAAQRRNTGLASDRRLDFRIGIHLGDVIAEPDGDLMGDGVNIAARLQGIAAAGGVSLSQAAYEQVRDRINVSFSDRGEALLKNIARPLRVFDVAGLAAAPAHAAEARESLVPPDRPSIAVLPFQNMSGDPEQEYFADGMVEEIITGLSRIKWLFVIARNSTFTYKGRTVDVKQVGRDLGVIYVLEGSVRRAGSRIRIAGQLVNTQTGAHLWAERYDRSVGDIFALQDEITLAVVGAIEPSLRVAEIERVKRKRPENLDAYDFVLRALPFASRAMPHDSAKALPLVDRAIELEADYALAHAVAAWCYTQKFIRAGQREEDRAAGISHAETALAGGDDATTLAFAGWAISSLAHDRSAALDAFERALVISPSSVIALNYSAAVLGYMGNTDEALKRVELALRLNPFDPMRWTSHITRSIAYFFDGNYQEAAESARRTVQANPGFSSGYAFLAASLARLGQVAESKSAAAHVLKMEPTFSAHGLASLYYDDSGKRNLFDALRAAGLPE